MSELYDATLAFFQEDGWDPRPLSGDSSTFRCAFRGKTDTWLVIVQVLDDREAVMCYSVSPYEATRDQLPAAAEYVTRANYGLVAANFELSYEDGDIRVKTVVDTIELPEGTISSPVFPAMLRQAAYANVLAMEQYLPGLKSVLEGTATPEQAIAIAEREA
ncbi:MAG: YbjN domain-containing protein [Hyphomicrobiales bacterium]